MMTSNSKKSYFHGFILTEQEFRRIHELANTQMRKRLVDKSYTVEFELIYKNGVVYSHTDFESIFTEENIGSSAIQNIIMHCYDSKNTPTTEINLEFNNPSVIWYERYSIRYKVRGEERDWVFITSSQLDERIKRTRRIAIKKFFSHGIDGIISYIGVSALFCFILFLPFLWLGQKFYPNPSPPDFYINYREVGIQAYEDLEKNWKEGNIKDATEVQLKALKIVQYNLGGVEFDPIRRKQISEYFERLEKIQSRRKNYHIVTGLILILIPIIFPLTMYCYPAHIFYWGENMKTIDKKRNVGKFLLIGVLLTIVLSVISEYLYDILKK